MNYRITEIHNLMDYEFSQVEGNFSSLQESDFKRQLPHNTSFQKFLEQLRNGHSVLLTDVPITHLLIQDRDEWNNKYWRVNPEIESNLDALAINAYARRLDFVNYGIGSSASGSSINTSMNVEPYIEHESKPLSIEERLQKQRLERQAEITQAWDDSQKKKAQEKQDEEENKFYLGWIQSKTTQSQEMLWQGLFTSDTSKEQQQFIRQCNSHLNNPVREGEIVVVPTSKPSNSQEKQTLSELQDEARAASVELGKLNDEQVSMVNRHLFLLDYYANQTFEKIKEDGLPSDYYSFASLGVGMATSTVERHLRNINGVLLEINDLYSEQVAMASRTGGVNYGSFISERAELFKKLDGSFAGLSKRNIHLPIYTQIKRNLKLSTKSVVHNAEEILEKGFVKNLGKRIANISIGVSISKGVGYIGLALGAASTADNIYEACKVDSTGNCGQTSSREVGGFLGGIYLGAQAGAWAAGGIALVLSAASTPVVAIAVTGAFVIGGSFGGVVGSTLGKSTGDLVYDIYEWFAE